MALLRRLAQGESLAPQIMKQHLHPVMQVFQLHAQRVLCLRTPVVKANISLVLSPKRFMGRTFSTTDTYKSGLVSESYALQSDKTGSGFQGSFPQWESRESVQ